MKTIRKMAKFGSKPDQKFYHESFDNYKEFLDVIEKRQPNAHQTLERTLESGGEDWVGIDSVEKAKDLLMNGWQQNVEKLKVAFNKELGVLEKNTPRKMFSSVAGFMPIVPNALLGLPNSMLDIKQEAKKTKVIKFLVCVGRSCGNSASEIIEKMSKMFAYIAAIERSGQYRCRIEIFWEAFGDDENDRTHTSMSVLVKSENQLFDIKRLCFPVIHPAMLRLFAFAWNESLPLEYNSYREGGYGKSFEHWGREYKKDFLEVLRTGNEKTICLDLHSNIEELFKKEVK